MSNDWRDRARTALADLARSGQEFTSDDLLARLGPPDPDHRPNAGNSAIGSIFREAAQAGLIVSDGSVVKSHQPHRKSGAVRVWKGA